MPQQEDQAAWRCCRELMKTEGLEFLNLFEKTDQKEDISQLLRLHQSLGH